MLTRSRRTGPGTKTVDLVLERDNYSCVRCGDGLRGQRGVDYSTHHRQPRGMGGSVNANGPENLLSLCGSGTTGCHGHVESYRTEAYWSGHLVSRHATPAAVPVLIAGGRWVFLTADGGYSDTPPEVTE